MGQASPGYKPLDVDSLASRLIDIPAVSSRLGTATDSWDVKEVGDGNLNLVFIVRSPSGALIVKQALPYVRLVGDSWPLPLNRSFFEYHALTRQGLRAEGMVPEVFYFDEDQALIVMEFLNPHHILRHSMQKGLRHDGLGEKLGRFCADTLFRGSDLHMEAAARKADVALFSGNVALCDITESLVFTDPYFDAPMNRHTTPFLDEIVADLRQDVALKIAAQQMKMAFCSRAETMLHGDLHTGSVMVHDTDVKVIDPEFALYGPFGFDIGMLIANFIMAWCAQPGYETDADSRVSYSEWLLQVIVAVQHSFVERFSELWHTERHGIMYPASLFEDQQQADGANQALQQQLQIIWQDTLGFCGAEIIRRTLGLAHIIEYDDIADESLRADCEASGLRIGRELLLQRCNLHDVDVLIALIRQQETGR